MSGGDDFDRLPAGARTDLAERGYDRAYFAAAPAPLRQTIKNVYAKMAALGLFRYVGQESESAIGCLQFRCPDLDGFRGALVQRGFSRPQPQGGFWDCRERRARCSLHIKHFAGWPEDRVQAHIDVFGVWPKQARWWLFPPLPAGLPLLHLLTPRSYLDQDRIARILIRQGLDPRIVSGPTTTSTAESGG